MPKESKSETTKNNKQNRINTKDYRDHSSDEHESVLKNILKKLKKIHRVLPLVLTTSEAFVKGLNNCFTCNMNKEDYKQIMQDVTIIGLLVDSVIEKEQTDLMDNSDKEDVDKRYNRSGGGEITNNNNTKHIDQVEENISKTCSKHSLQCSLIKLQKTIGDVLVQVCFVKSNHLGNIDKYRKFDITLDDLRLLKFEYTNVTDKIISLFNTSQVKTLPKSELCVSCLKEKIFLQINVMTDIVKSGKNLKLVMRNQNGDPPEGQCCHRGYPHVHAQTQGRPIVLKYTRPLNAAVPSTHPPNNTPGKQETFEENVRSYNVKSNSDNQSLNAAASSTHPPNNTPVKQDTVEKNIHSDNLKSNSYNQPLNTAAPSTHPPNNTPVNQETVQENVNSYNVKSNSDNQLHSTDNARKVDNNNTNVNDLVEDEQKMPVPNIEDSNHLVGKDTSSNIEKKPSTDIKLNERKYLSSSHKDTESKHSSSVNSINAFAEELSEEESSAINSESSVSYYDRRNLRATSKFLSKNKEKQENSDEEYEEESFVNNESSKGLKTDNDNPSRNPFGNETVERTLYVDPGEPNMPRKKRVSFADEMGKYTFQRNYVYSIPSTSNSGLNNSVFKASIMKKDKPDIVENAHNINDIKHHNRKVEMVLRSLGADSLLMVSSPAKCSKVNTLLSSNKDESNLPLSPSLYSLPLDINDLKYVAKEVEKLVLVNMEQELQTPVAEFECNKIDTTGKTTELNNTKFNRTLAGSETQWELTDCKKESLATMKHGLENDNHNHLPTIDEEEPYLRYDTNINNVNHIIDINEGNTRMNSHQTPILKTKSTELRYCMVEFENKHIGLFDGLLWKKEHLENIINNEQKAESGSLKAQKSGSFILHNISQGGKSDPFHEMDYNKSKSSTKSLSMPTIHNSLSLALDELTILNAIYLTETEPQNEAIEFNVKSIYKGTLDCSQKELLNRFNDTSCIL